MKNEHDRNLNVMRVLLELCEEGATQELSDCGADGEPWTEEDRRSSRATAEWLRATCFPPLPARSKPTRKRSGEQLFSDDQIWKQLESGNPERRRCAVAALDALADLASMRARKLGTSFLIERTLVFDAALLDTDIRGRDRELAAVALDAWDEVSFLAGLVAMDTHVPSQDDLKWAQQVREQLQVKLDELRKRVIEKRDNGVAQ